VSDEIQAGLDEIRLWANEMLLSGSQHSNQKEKEARSFVFKNSVLFFLFPA
jgi:hypothetical protein